MKYLLLSYTPADAWDPADADTGTPSEEALAAFAIYAEFQRELTASGELVATEGLGHPSLSQTLPKRGRRGHGHRRSVRGVQRGPGQLRRAGLREPRSSPGDRPAAGRGHRRRG
jgi:hypothetical protein